MTCENKLQPLLLYLAAADKSENNCPAEHVHHVLNTTTPGPTDQ